MNNISKIVLTFNVALVILNISLLSIVYFDRESSDLDGSIVGSQASTLSTRQDATSGDEDTRQAKLNAALSKLPSSTGGSTKPEAVSTEFESRQPLSVSIPTVDRAQLQPNQTRDSESVSADQIDAAVSFKDSYTSTTKKLEELLVSVNNQ